MPYFYYLSRNMAMVILEGDILFQNIHTTQAAIGDARLALDQAIQSLHTVNRRQLVHAAKDVLLQAMLLMLEVLNRLSAIKSDQGREITPSIKENGRMVVQRLTVVRQLLRDVLALVEIDTSDATEIQNMLVEIQNHLREIDRQYSEMYNNAMIVTEQMNVEGGRRRKSLRKSLRKRKHAKHTYRKQKHTYRKRKH